MKLLIYGGPREREALPALLAAGPLAFRQIDWRFCGHYDDYLAALRDNPGDVIMITAAGAAGMEGVKAARTLAEGVPVLWFSEDRAFCAESYRLNCRFFGEKPVTAERLTEALERCGSAGQKARRIGI